MRRKSPFTWAVGRCVNRFIFIPSGLKDQKESVPCFAARIKGMISEFSVRKSFLNTA